MIIKVLRISILPSNQGHNRGGSRISERGGESDRGKGHAHTARGYGGAL